MREGEVGTGKSDAEQRSSAHFYAQSRAICQLLKDGEDKWDTIGEEFFSFFLKNEDGEG
jgi:hypothetical protein